MQIEAIERSNTMRDVEKFVEERSFRRWGTASFYLLFGKTSLYAPRTSPVKRCFDKETSKKKRLEKRVKRKKGVMLLTEKGGFVT